MGTNYYALLPPDGTASNVAGARERLHVGLASHGHAFRFHGVHERGLTSAAAWAALLLSDGVLLESEYGIVVEPRDFLAMARVQLRDHLGEPGCMLDPEGYSFDYGEFS